MSQLRAIQEVLQNVKMGNIPIPPKLIKGTPRNQIGKGLSTLCCYKTGPRRIKAVLAGNNQTGRRKDASPGVIQEAQKYP